MSNFFETPEWTSGIYKLNVTDPVQGGDVLIESGVVIEGFSNVQALQLTNRTAFLKQQIDNLNTQQNVQSDGNIDDRAILVYDEAGELYKGSLYRQATPDDAGAGRVLEVGSFGLGSTTAISVDFSTFEGTLPSGVYRHSGTFYEGESGGFVFTHDPVLVATTEEPATPSQSRSFALFRMTGGGMAYMTNVNAIDYTPPIPLLDPVMCDAVQTDLFTSKSKLVHEAGVHGSVSGNFTLNVAKAYHVINLVGASNITLNIGSVPTTTPTSFRPIENPVTEFTIVLRNQTIPSNNTVTFTNSNIRWEGGSFNHVGTSLETISVIEGRYSTVLGLYFLSAKSYS